MLNLANIFGNMLSGNLDAQNIVVIIPMPIHSKRLKERSFNQSLEIAKVLTKNNSEKLRHSTEKRQRYRPPKVSLLLKERTKNINRVFATNAVLTCKRIAIVDYVMTTGPSLNELAKTLKKASAAHVKC